MGYWRRVQAGDDFYEALEAEQRAAILEQDRTLAAARLKDIAGLGAGSAAPDDADYLVGTAHAGLSGEIAVGTTPGGELGGSWGSPTVDGTHSGSAHHAQAHGPSQHTEGNAWKLLYLDASGDETEIAVGADGTVLTGTGTSGAPAFEAASEHAHANDHAQAHGPSDHTGFANWKVIYTDASGDQQEVAVGADGTVFTGTGAASAPAFEAADEHAHTNDHAQAHAPESHTGTDITAVELETLSDGSTAGGLHVHVEAEITDLDHLTGAEAIAAVEGEATLDLTGDVTIAAAKSLAVDTIGEKTGAAGVTIDTVLIKDGDVDGRDVSVIGAKLDGIAAGADVTANNAPKAHTASHTDGTDDIQTATTAQKGVVSELATTAEATTGTDTARVTPVSALPLQIQDSKWSYAADAEASDTYVISMTPNIAAYAIGQVFHFKANTINTGAATLNVDGQGAITIKKLHDTDLANGDIEAGQIVTVVYDGTNFQMQSQIANAAAGGGTPTLIEDADQDTAWEAEQAADEDKLRGKVGGTERHLIQTASPEHTLTGDVLLNGTVQLLSTAALTAGTCLKIYPTAVPGGGTSMTGINLRPTSLTATNFYGFQIAPSGFTMSTGGRAYGVNCVSAFGLAASAASGTIRGLNFEAGVALGSGATLTELTALRVRTFGFMASCAITTGRAMWVPRGTYPSAVQVTNWYGLDLENQNESDITNQTLVRLGDATGATTTNYIIDAGPTPYLRLKGSGTGGWTAAANETPLWLAADAGPTLYQVTVGAADSGGAGYRVLRIPN